MIEGSSGGGEGKPGEVESVSINQNEVSKLSWVPQNIHYTKSKNMLIRYLGDKLKKKGLDPESLTESNLNKFIQACSGKGEHLVVLSHDDAVKFSSEIADRIEFQGDKEKGFFLYFNENKTFLSGTIGNKGLLLAMAKISANKKIDGDITISSSKSNIFDMQEFKYSNEVKNKKNQQTEKGDKKFQDQYAVKTQSKFVRICKHMMIHNLVSPDEINKLSPQEKNMIAMLNSYGRRALVLGLEKNQGDLKEVLAEVHSNPGKYINPKSAEFFAYNDLKIGDKSFTVGLEKDGTVNAFYEKLTKRKQAIDLAKLSELDKKNEELIQTANEVKSDVKYGPKTQYLINRFPLLDPTKLVYQFGDKKGQDLHLDDLNSYKKLEDLGKILMKDKSFKYGSSKYKDKAIVKKLITDVYRGGSNYSRMSNREEINEQFKSGFTDKVFEDNVVVRESLLEQGIRRDPNRVPNFLTSDGEGNVKPLEYLKGTYFNLEPRVLDKLFANGVEDGKTNIGELTCKNLDDLGRMLSADKKFLAGTYKGVDDKDLDAKMSQLNDAAEQNYRKNKNIKQGNDLTEKQSSEVGTIKNNAAKLVSRVQASGPIAAIKRAFTAKVDKKHLDKKYIPNERSGGGRMH